MPIFKIVQCNKYNTERHNIQQTMSSAIFHQKFPESVSSDPSHLELGNQLLALLKLVIYCLVGLKFFQLIFLKFRKQLTISDRVERKYRYSHSQLLSGYSESESKLMEITICNTVRNAQIMPTKELVRKSRSSKQVSFKEENNCYHSIISTRNCSDIDEEQFKQLGVESKLLRETAESQFFVAERSELSEMNLVDQQVNSSQISQISQNTVNTVVSLVEQGSQLSQQTQTSLVPESSISLQTPNPSQCSQTPENTHGD